MTSLPQHVWMYEDDNKKLVKTTDSMSKLLDNMMEEQRGINQFISYPTIDPVYNVRSYLEHGMSGNRIFIQTNIKSGKQRQLYRFKHG
jgi:hypothetical protein